MSLHRPSGPPLALDARVLGCEPSATIAINARSKALAAEGRTIYRLGLGQSPFPVPAHVRAALAAHAAEKDYLPVKGLPALRSAVVDWTRRTEGVERDAEAVIVGPGTKELMFQLQLTYAGDLVIPAPSWVSYAPQAGLVGRAVRWLPTRAETGLAVEPDALAALCEEAPERPRLLILNSPGNPTGRCYTDDELAALAQVLRRYRVLALSDEIYSGTHFAPVTGASGHRSLARHYPEGTIISNGLSKWCGAGGWRLGWFAAPTGLRPIIDAMAAVASETFTSTSAPIQYAAVSALRPHPEMEQYLTDSRRVLAATLGWASAKLRAAGATLPRADGGFYLFPDLSAHRSRLAERGITDSPTLCRRLLDDTGVAVLPGTCFGRPADELSLRMALVDFDGGAALDAASKRAGGGPLDAEFVAARCPAVVAAISHLVDWVAR